MKKTTIMIALGTMLLVLWLIVGAEKSTDPILPPSGKPLVGSPYDNAVDADSVFQYEWQNYVLTGPLSKENLSIYLIQGEAELNHRAYTALGKAMEEGHCRIIETSDVNELQIHNTGQSDVFVYGGDIVKGGKQDRTAQYDMIVPRGVKAQPFPSFCVEQGRWSKREAEDEALFSVSEKTVSSNKIKAKARYRKSQQGVWSEVRKMQSKLSRGLSYEADKEVNVADSTSASSLQLSLENKELDSLNELYSSYFEEIMDGREDILGILIVLNGQPYNLELFNHHALFGQLSDKLIESAITEAIAERDSSWDGKLCQVEEMRTFMENGNGEEAQIVKVNDATEFWTQADTSKHAILFRTIDLRENKQWLHYNVLAINLKELEEPARFIPPRGGRR